MTPWPDPENPDADTVVRVLPPAPAVGVRRYPRSKHVIRGVIVVVSATLVGLTMLFATAKPAKTYQAFSPLVGHQAPHIAGTTLLGQRFDLDAPKGRFVVVDFFSSWCVACHTEQSQLELFAQHPYDGAQLVGVVFQDLNSSALAMFGPWRGLYPVLGDPGGKIALNYGVDNPPTKFIIDLKGRVIAKVIGPVTAAGLNSLLVRANNQSL